MPEPQVRQPPSALRPAAARTIVPPEERPEGQQVREGGTIAPVIIHNHIVMSAPPAPAPVALLPQTLPPVAEPRRDPPVVQRLHPAPVVIDLTEPEPDAIIPAAEPKPKDPKAERAAKAAEVVPEGTEILSIVPRINAEDMKRGKVNDGSARDLERTLQLFVEMTGVGMVEAMTQAHLSEFVDLCAMLPKNYRKSEAERNKPIGDIIEAAQEDPHVTFISAATINKSLTNITKLIKKARSYGISVSGTLDPGLLRISEKGAAKDQRKAFTLDDIRSIFGHASLTPGVNRARPEAALFWVAHIAALTGARREEICGLAAEDLEVRDGIHVLFIRPNRYRRLKTEQSERVVPLHRDLIALGFVGYAAKREPGGMMFDLRKKAKGASYGDSIDYRWRQAQSETVGTGQRKSFHSFRHSAIDALIKAKVGKQTRAQLFGHLVGDIEGDRYVGEPDLRELCDAIELLPSVRA
ncbi:site-specific integrase [Paracoccus caeni]|uniref:site-specific integrase n=1 Tax=Paracoccus caeni TaxID=657651 RepID=UPI00190BA5F5|nr:site-specific integrase [Paracoccus caeni]